MFKTEVFSHSIWKTIDYLLVCQPVNRFWLTDFESSYGFLLLSKKNQTGKLFLDNRYLAEGKKVVQHYQIVSLTQFYTIWTKLSGCVGFELDLTYASYQMLQKLNPKVVLKPVDFQRLRMIKTAKEIKQIERVCQKTAQIWRKIENNYQKFQTEKHLEKFILIEALQTGARENAFFPIVSSDQRAALIHTKAQNFPVSDHFLCDFGLKINGYCSDFTRSVIIDPVSKMGKYLKIIQHIQKKVIDKVKPGTPIAVLAQTANDLYQQHNLKLEHALGHGIGLEVHEQPNITINNNEVLQPGMIFTVEPGVYLPNLGGVRVEDVVLVTETGCRVLTQVLDVNS